MEVPTEPNSIGNGITHAIEIRPEQPEDLDAIREVVRDAFGRDFEAIMVDRLRASEAYIPELSLVAVENGSVVGHVMITSQDIVSDNGSVVATTILAPLAVATEHQNRGIGQALTKAARAAKSAGHRSMMVVDHPTYYPQFGFRPASTWGIRYVAPIPDDVFMAIELVPGALVDAAGTVSLSAAFDET